MAKDRKLRSSGHPRLKRTHYRRLVEGIGPKRLKQKPEKKQSRLERKQRSQNRKRY